MTQMDGTFEGTGNGENEPSKFEDFMKEHTNDVGLINVLIENGIDSIDALRELKGNDKDIDEVVKECKLKIGQKLKLKAIIKKIPTQLHNIVEKEEREAIINIDKKLKLIEESMNKLTETKNNIDSEVANGQQLIEKSFMQIFEALNKRKKVLIDKLNKFGNDKKIEIEQQQKILNKYYESIQKTSFQLHQSLRKSLQLEEIENRKNKILTAAKDIDNIKIIQKNNTFIDNCKVNLNLDSKELINIVNAFGNVLKKAPIFVSIKDNKDLTVNIGWKLNQNDIDTINVNDERKIKVEWNENELKNNDNDNNDDIKWNNNKIFIVNHKNGSIIKLNINKANINYIFRISYYSSSHWSLPSDIKSIFIKKTDFIEFRLSNMKLTPTEKQNITKYLRKVILNKNDINLSCTLLYSGFRDGLGASQWHAKCDNNCNVLTLIQTEHNHIFGCFSSIGFQKSKNNYCLDTKAFLCLIRTTFPNAVCPKYSQYVQKNNNDQSAIYCGATFGPCFGFSFDVGIFAGSNSSNYCNHAVNGTRYPGFTGNELCGGLTKSIVALAGQSTFKIKFMETYKINNN